MHGISDEMVADKPRFPEIAAEVAEALAGVVPAAYNAGFDRGFILAEFERAGLGREQLPPSLSP